MISGRILQFEWMAELLPLWPQMELISRRKARREESPNEEKFRFPALDETWEVSCSMQEEWKSQTTRNKKADHATRMNRFSGSAVA